MTLFAAYRPAKGFRLKINTDIAFVSTGFSLRFIPEAMYTFKTGNLSLSLRQRILWSWKKPTGKWTMWYRTRGLVAYNIPGTSVSPLIAVQPFYRDILSRIRYYAGFRVPATENATLMIQYNPSLYVPTSQRGFSWVFVVMAVHEHRLSFPALPEAYAAVSRRSMRYILFTRVQIYPHAPR